ncbi:putative LIGULELESS1 protein [Corchorus olitorius]|uniref:LIGULELESS1 protein n=1 Tax=Corchorus olitorius TaxID=93759 RepID=A0A1R3KWV8_9ROSI|nr:putative LIGULELESS1 protein [Corchorus olitorius]
MRSRIVIRNSIFSNQGGKLFICKWVPMVLAAPICKASLIDYKAVKSMELMDFGFADMNKRPFYGNTRM